MIKGEALQSLAAIVGDHHLIVDPNEMVVYEMDATQERGIPDAIVFPQSVQEIARLVKWAAERHLPLVARGAGTGLSGGAVPDKGGLVVEFSKLNRILEVDTVGRSLVAEPGTVNLVLDGLVKTQGLYFPPDPASGRSSTFGGNVAENAGGPHCFKYGVTCNYITGLQVVLADGRVVQLGGRAYDYPEYDLAGLVTGSEGTLGLITRMDARLMRNPPGLKTMMAAFDSVESAGRAVSAVIAAGLVPATMEMMDQKIMRIVEEFVPAGLPVEAGAMLIVEVDGYPTSLDTQMSEAARILEQHQGHHLRIAQTAEERDRIWYGRKSAAGCMAKLAPAYFLVDGTVPRSHLAETLDAVTQICERKNLSVGYVFHAGDGNLHPFIPFTPSDQDQVARGWQACEEIMRAVVARDGSITGEHGIGIEKREFMSFMYSGTELAAMWDVKQVFDPHGVMNPGKIFPSKMPPVNQAKPMAHVPGDEFTPTTAEETAAGLAALAAIKKSVYVNHRRDGAVTLLTQALHGIAKYAPEDLYITVRAGTPLEEVQAFLSNEGRQVPLVAPWKETTVGAIIGANLNSPQRIRYGAVRDLLLDCTVALADGRLIRAGRAVVKNVAGYDLPKVFVGSHGTLGVLTDVTFKLMPLPRSKRTLVVPVDDLAQGLRWASQLLGVALMASAVVVVKSPAVLGLTSPYALAYTAEGLAEDVEAELMQVRQILRNAKAPTASEVSSPTGVELWCDLMRSITPQSLCVRVGVAPKDLRDYVASQSAELNTGMFLADIASGLVYVVVSPQSGAAANAQLNAFRRPAVERGGYAIASFVPEALRGTMDCWGYSPDALDLMRRLKTRWDPANILGVGEFVV